jgi:hypothetical protein
MQGAQVAVPTLGDSPQPSLETAGVLARRQAQVAREVPGGGKAANVPEKGHKGSGGEQPYARDGEQPDHGGGLLRQCGKVLVDLLDARLDVANLLAGLGEDSS